MDQAIEKKAPENDSLSAAPIRQYSAAIGKNRVDPIEKQPEKGSANGRETEVLGT